MIRYWFLDLQGNWFLHLQLLHYSLLELMVEPSFTTIHFPLYCALPWCVKNSEDAQQRDNLKYCCKEAKDWVKTPFASSVVSSSLPSTALEKSLMLTDHEKYILMTECF